MEDILIKTLPQLGVGVAAVVVIYLLMAKAFDALNVRDAAFKNFVESNNHRSIEVMTECRDVIREAALNIQQNTEIQKQVVEHLIKTNSK